MGRQYCRRNLLDSDWERRERERESQYWLLVGRENWRVAAVREMLQSWSHQYQTDTQAGFSIRLLPAFTCDLVRLRFVLINLLRSLISDSSLFLSLSLSLFSSSFTAILHSSLLPLYCFVQFPINPTFYF